jgi:formyltetrahydrofolate deformylase
MTSTLIGRGAYYGAARRGTALAKVLPIRTDWPYPFAPRMPPIAIFNVTANDQPGLVARLAGFFYERALNIVDASNHTDLPTEGSDAKPAAPARFFMRLVVDLGGLASPSAPDALGGSATRKSLEAQFDQLVTALSGRWSVGYSDVVPKVAILVTKEAACLYDLVLRQRSGELACEIPLIVSNHPTLEHVAEGFRIPFFCLPVTRDTKAEQEARVLDLLARHHVDLVVLARYMQVLSADFLRKAPPVINIHHGFLPAFQGAKPYHQAWTRGVKMIGATAHYATEDLDQGPIIEQDVARVTHQMPPEELVRVGRDVERVVLARAVRAHVDRRVFVEGRRTILL